MNHYNRRSGSHNTRRASYAYPPRAVNPACPRQMRPIAEGSPESPWRSMKRRYRHGSFPDNAITSANHRRNPIPPSPRSKQIHRLHHNDRQYSYNQRTQMPRKTQQARQSIRGFNQGIPYDVNTGLPTPFLPPVASPNMKRNDLLTDIHEKKLSMSQLKQKYRDGGSYHIDDFVWKTTLISTCTQILTVTNGIHQIQGEIKEYFQELVPKENPLEYATHFWRNAKSLLKKQFKRYIEFIDVVKKYVDAQACAERHTVAKVITSSDGTSKTNKKLARVQKSICGILKYFPAGVVRAIWKTPTVTDRMWNDFLVKLRQGCPDLETEIMQRAWEKLTRPIPPPVPQNMPQEDP